MVPLTTSQVDRLGERLRTSETISEEDLVALQTYRAEHEEAMVAVQRRIEEVLPGIDQTTRIETIGTLHDKLRRQPTKLSRIQDIAGVRIVQDMDLNEQDRLVGALERAFNGAKRVDRRARPMLGYRAVHVIVRIGRCNCEIQVRTVPQHLWAEISERLGDQWGRQIRYGGEPTQPRRKVGAVTRVRFWQLFVSLSDDIHGLEEIAANQNLGVDSGTAPEGWSRVELEQARHDVRKVLAELADFLARGAEL